MALQPDNHLIIVYHADCIDGAASAWIIDKAEGAGKNITYISYDHSDSAAAEDNIRAALQPGAEIYFADLTPEKPFLNELISSGRNIHILDHHKSAAEKLKGIHAANLHIHMDAAAPSASGMIWRHFFTAKEAPDVIDLIDKMDGSGAGLKTRQDFAAAALVDAQNIRTKEQAFKSLRDLAKLTFNAMAKKGAPLAKDQEVRIDRLLENAASAKVQLLPGTEPVNVPIVNGGISEFGRQVSGRLVDLGKEKGVNVGFIWSVQKTGTVSLSIRTDGSPDASQIAGHLCKTMGATGGGHKDAAAVHFASLSEFAKYMPIKPPGPTAARSRPTPPSPFSQSHPA